MQIRRVSSTNPDTTIEGMKTLVREFRADVAPFAFLSIEDFFDIVKNLPYKMESPSLGMQILQRPKFTLQRKVNVVACANKAILISSFLTNLGIPNGFVISANKATENYGHVFNWARLFGNRVFIDATYPENEIFREKKYAKRKVYE